MIFGDGSAERRAKRRRRPRRVPPGDAATIVTCRVTVIDTTELTEPPSGSPDQNLFSSLHTLNRVVNAWRVAAHDPYTTPVRQEQALVIRSGYGSGEEVANGQWSDAVELPPLGSKRRRSILDPHERLTSLIGGKEDPYEFENLTLSSRLSLNSELYTTAALQLDLALDVATEELRGSAECEPLLEAAARIEPIAETAVGGTLSDSEIETLSDAQLALERVVRRLAHGAQVEPLT